MAVESPPWATQAGSFNAEQTRRAVFAAYARTAANNPGIVAGGLLSTADLQLSAPVSGMSVNVSAGECIIGGSEGGAQGGYYARGTSQTNLAIAASNPSNPRIDTVCATSADAQYTIPTGGTSGQWTLQVVTGTPTSGATLGNLNGAATLPLSSLLLGYVLVPANATNIITADIANVAGVVPLNVPGREWSYTQITSPVNITDTSEGTATALISPAAFTPDGSPVMVEFFAPYIKAPNAAVGDNVNVTLWEGATEISRLAYVQTPVGATLAVAVVGRLRFTPTAASHTYKVCAFVNTTTGTPQIGAGSGGVGGHAPAYVRFTRA